MGKQTKKLEDLSLKEIARRIGTHLKRFEHDKKINAPRPEAENTRPYYNAWAARAGSRVRVQYISYQWSNTLTKADAVAYLRRLDGGFVGRHFEALREKE